MKLNFTLSEFNISGNSIPEKVADKILHKHIVPMQPVREELGFAIYPSLKSAYRPLWWEKENDRSGTSQHTFIGEGEVEGDGDGATDWTCYDFKNNKEDLLESIIKHTKYTRISIYSSFIHCDYKKTGSGKRELFIYKYNDEKKEWGWEFKNFI